MEIVGLKTVVIPVFPEKGTAVEWKFRGIKSLILILNTYVGD
jgi:hypothetical protein